MGSQNAVVVGAGIAGLAAAISTAQQGWNVTVLERAEQAAEVGAGFAMTRNAVAAFKGLGFTDSDVAKLGQATYMGGTYDQRGHPILTYPNTPEVRERVRIIGAHRARVHAALMARAQSLGVRIVTNTAVTTLEPGQPEGRPAVIAGREADLVIAADGVRSAVRAALLPDTKPMYSGYSSWRAIVPGAFGAGAFELFWGRHAEFGILGTTPARATAETSYWYGYVRMAERTDLGGPEAELAEVKARAKNWAAPVKDVVDATDPAALLRHDVYFLPRGGVPCYTVGRVVFIGDAAHATLPTMGQGAATALEDGLCVGLLVAAPVAAGGTLAPALEAYECARRPRNRSISRGSISTARVGAHLGAGQKLRNTLAKFVPTSAVVKGADAITGWTPPPPALPTHL